MKAKVINEVIVRKAKIENIIAVAIVKSFIFTLSGILTISFDTNAPKIQNGMVTDKA